MADDFADWKAQRRAALQPAPGSTAADLAGTVFDDSTTPPGDDFAQWQHRNPPPVAPTPKPWTQRLSESASMLGSNLAEGAGKLWEGANYAPLHAPAAKFADWITEPSLTDRPSIAALKGFAGGATQGAADLATPLNVASFASGPVGRVAQGAVAAGQAIHGAPELYKGIRDENWQQAGMGAFEVGMAGLGAHGAMQPHVPTARPEVSIPEGPHLPRGAQRIESPLSGSPAGVRYGFNTEAVPNDVRYLEPFSGYGPEPPKPTTAEVKPPPSADTPKPPAEPFYPPAPPKPIERPGPAGPQNPLEDIFAAGGTRFGQEPVSTGLGQRLSGDTPAEFPSRRPGGDEPPPPTPPVAEGPPDQLTYLERLLKTGGFEGPLPDEGIAADAVREPSAPDVGQPPIAAEPLAAPGRTLDPNAPAPAGPVQGSAPPELPPADAGGVVPVGRDPVSAPGGEPVGLTAAERIAQEQAARVAQQKQKRADARARPKDITSDLIADARTQGYTGDPEALRSIIQERIDLAKEMDAALRQSDTNPDALVSAIEGFGGIKDEGGYGGEIARLKESPNKRLSRRVFKDSGRSVDDILGLLKQEGNFRHLETPDDVIRALDEAHTPQAGFDLEGDLAKMGVKPGAKWWETPAAPAGEPDFAFGENAPPETPAPPASPLEDILSTGEAQPRLPGDVGAVRDTNRPMPKEDLPYALEAELPPAAPAKPEPSLLDAPPEKPAVRFNGWQDAGDGTFAPRYDVADPTQRGGWQMALGPESLRERGLDVPEPPARPGDLKPLEDLGIVPPEPPKPLPANVRDYLVKQLKYAPEDVAAMAPDDAVALGKANTRNPNAPPPPEPPPGPPPLPERSSLPNMEDFDALRTARGQQRRAKIERSAVPLDATPATEGGPPPRTASERAGAGEPLTTMERESLGLPPEVRERLSVSLRERGVSPRQIKQRVERMDAWAADPTPENFSRLVEAQSEQARAVNEKQLKGGTGTEGDLPPQNDKGTYLYSGFGAFNELRRQNPAAFRVLMQAGAGALTGALVSGDEHKLRGAVFGALVGAGLSPSLAKAVNQSFNKVLSGTGVFDVLKRQALGTAGGAIIGAAADEKSPGEGALTGAALGFFGASLPPEFRRSLRFGSMLSGQAQLTNVLGNTGSIGAAVAEHFVAGRRDIAQKIVKATLDLPELIRTVGKAGFNETTEVNAKLGESLPSAGFLSIPGRVMNAADAVTRGVLEKGGLTPELANLYAYRNKPLSDIGQRLVDLQQHSGVVKEAVPFIKTAVNLAERGIERSPFGLWRLYQGMPKAEQAMVLSQAALGTAAIVAGYAVGGDHPFLIGLAGPYALPFAGGMALRRAGDEHQQWNASKIISATLENIIKGLPVIPNVSDLRKPVQFAQRYVASHVPSIVRPFNPDTWSGTKRQVAGEGILAETKARIPGIAQTMPINQRQTQATRKRAAAPPQDDNLAALERELRLR
jgi:hypothetical protein